MTNLADAYIAQGKLAEAEPLLAAALKGYRARGEDNVKLLESLNDEGLKYLKRGQPGKAETFFAQALDGFRRAKGEADPNTLTVMANLALRATAWVWGT